MKNLEELLKNKAIKLLLVILVIGFVLSHFWTIVWYAVIGTVVTIAGISLYSLYEAHIDAQKQKAKDRL